MGVIREVGEGPQRGDRCGMTLGDWLSVFLVEGAVAHFPVKEDMRIKLGCVVSWSTFIVINRIGTCAKCASSFDISSRVTLGNF